MTGAADAKKIVLGNLLSGEALIDLDAPFTRTTSAIIALQTTEPGLQENPCMRCGRCSVACPVDLVPSQIVDSIRSGEIDAASAFNMMRCIDCGCCAYVCPSKINLLHFIAWGKAQRSVNTLQESC